MTGAGVIGNRRAKRSRIRRLSVESLESRCLLAGVFDGLINYGETVEVNNGMVPWNGDILFITDDFRYHEPVSVDTNGGAMSDAAHGSHSSAATDTSTVATVQYTVTDLDGNPIDHVEVGDSFLLNVAVQDARTDPQGVFSMYFDLLYDPALLEVIGEIEHSDYYSSLPMGDGLRPGIINESGGFSNSLKPLGAGVLPLYSVPMRAIAAGTALIAGNPADCKPVTDVGVYGDDNSVAEERIDYGEATLQIGTGGKSESTRSELEAGADSCSSIAKPVAPIEHTIADEVAWLEEQDASDETIRDFLAVHTGMSADLLLVSSRGAATVDPQVFWLPTSLDAGQTLSSLDEPREIPLITSSTDRFRGLPIDAAESNSTDSSPRNAAESDAALELLDAVFAQIGEWDATL